MSSPVALAEPHRLAWYRSGLPLLAVGVGRLLCERSPATIRRTLRVLRRGARPATPAEAEAARDQVVATSVRCAGQGCIQRSIATVVLCRLRGSWPTWCSGVRIPPFFGHAWVEVDGEPIGEPYPPGYHRKLIEVPPAGRPEG
jgi:hypothetical protein